MSVAELTATIETIDGVLDIEAYADKYGFIFADMYINGKEWKEVFAEVSELKEFIDGLPIVSLIQASEYYFTQST